MKTLTTKFKFGFFANSNIYKGYTYPIECYDVYDLETGKVVECVSEPEDIPDELDVPCERTTILVNRTKVEVWIPLEDCKSRDADIPKGSYLFAKAITTKEMDVITGYLTEEEENQLAEKEYREEQELLMKEVQKYGFRNQYACYVKK